MSDLHSAAENLRAAEARSLPPLSAHQLYVLRCICEQTATNDSAIARSQHLVTARALAKRGLVGVDGYDVTLTKAGLEAATASVASLGDEELDRLARDMRSCFRDAANEILDARRADDVSRRTPAGGEA